MDIEKELEKLNFSKLEAQIYLALIEANPLSAYQIAKKIEISRTSIYNALEHMLDKGVVLLIPNDTSLYIPQEPDIIFEKRYKETVEAIDNAKQSLKVYKENKRNNSYLVLKEFDSIVLKVKEILKKAKNEITDMGNVVENTVNPKGKDKRNIFANLRAQRWNTSFYNVTGSRMEELSRQFKAGEIDEIHRYDGKHQGTLPALHAEHYRLWGGKQILWRNRFAHSRYLQGCAHRAETTRQVAGQELCGMPQ